MMPVTIYHILENGIWLMNTPDMAPTLLGLLGLDIPEEMEGMDLSHCALGQTGAEPEFAFLQGMGHTYQMNNLVGNVDSGNQLVKIRKQMAEKMKELNDEFREFTFYRDNWFAKDDPYSKVANAYGPFSKTYDRVASKRKDRKVL